MRKFLLLPILALVALVGFAPSASATIPEIIDIPGPTPQLKVDICHNGTVVPVSINAVLTAQDTGHGLLTLLPGLPPSFTFVAHAEAGGHEEDFVLRVYIKAGNTETNIVVADGDCEPDPEPLVTAQVCLDGRVEVFGPDLEADVTAAVAAFIAANAGAVELGEGEKCEKVTTVTTIVEKEVEKIVEKTVEVPGPTHIMEITRTVEVPVVVESSPPVTKTAEPTGTLPVTGTSPAGLALLGTSLTGIGVVLRRLFK